MKWSRPKPDTLLVPLGKKGIHTGSANVFMMKLKKDDYFVSTIRKNLGKPELVKLPSRASSLGSMNSSASLG